jgi:hypothetical protein
MLDAAEAVRTFVLDGQVDRATFEAVIGNQLRRASVDLSEARFDIPGGQPATLEREDLFVEPLEPPLALADDPRFEAAIAIPRSVHLQGPCPVISVFSVVPLRALPLPAHTQRKENQYQQQEIVA